MSGCLAKRPIVPLCSLLNVCAVQLKRTCLCHNPLGGTEKNDIPRPHPLSMGIQKKALRIDMIFIGSFGNETFLKIEVIADHKVNPRYPMQNFLDP